MAQSRLIVNRNIIFLGDSKTGKTATLEKLACPARSWEGARGYEPTVGVKAQVFHGVSKSGVKPTLTCIDTGGNEMLLDETYTHLLKGADGAVIMYDVSNSSTFDHIPLWIDLVERVCGNSIPFVICANKMDLLDLRGSHILENHQSFFSEKKIKHFEVSARTNGNLWEPVLYLTSELMSNIEVEYFITPTAVTSPPHSEALPEAMSTGSEPAGLPIVDGDGCGRRVWRKKAKKCCMCIATVFINIALERMMECLFSTE